MDELKQRIINVLLPFLDQKGYLFYDIEFTKEFGFKVVRVMVDKKDGINVDELAEVNEYLSPKLDDFDVFEDNYLLEVSSPGAEKPLRNSSEIMEAIGEYIFVKTDNGNFEGFLENYDNEVLTIKINVKGRIKDIIVKEEDIKLIRLAIKF